YEGLFFRRRGVLGTLVIAECLEGKGRFLDDIINGIWILCEKSTWCLPAHLYLSGNEEQLPDSSAPLIDLFAADTSWLLSWVHYLLKEKLDFASPQITKRIRKEIDQRILTPYLERNDFWWMGFGEREVNNWNPWCNSNILISVLLIEENHERAET
ncbi:heparinase, partial [Paenibacillus sp. TAF58]